MPQSEDSSWQMMGSGVPFHFGMSSFTASSRKPSCAAMHMCAPVSSLGVRGSFESSVLPAHGVNLAIDGGFDALRFRMQSIEIAAQTTVPACDAC